MADQPAALSIVEELALMLLKDEDGSVVALSPNWHMWCGFAGAILLELSFKQRIDADVTGLRVLDTTPTGNALVDPALALIAQADKVHVPQYWIEKLAMDGDELIDKVLEQLVEAGILFEDHAGFWSLTDKVRSEGFYPLAGDEGNEEVRVRIRNCVLGNDLPYPKDVTLIALLRACDAFKTFLTLDEYELAEERIQLLAGLDLFGKAILDVVGSSYQPPPSLLRRRARKMPSIGLWDCLKSKSLRQRNLSKFIAEQCQKIGPIFELKLPGRKYVVLAGDEANRWVSRRGRLFLRSRDYLEDFQSAWGAARSIASMDGPDHFRMRRVFRDGNSRKVVEGRMDEVYELGRSSLKHWVKGNVLTGEQTCQRFTGQQIAMLMVSVKPPIELLDALIQYEYRALLIHVVGLLPKIALKTPKMKRALKSVLELYRHIHASHSPGQRIDTNADFVDDLLALHMNDPQFMPDTDLEFGFIAPLIAGHYMGSALNFALYELLKNKECLKKVTAEADALFADRDPSNEDFTMERIDYTHRFIMEVLRLHPIIPMHSRTAMNSFDVRGFQVPERSSCLLVFTATHYMDEFFKDPDLFDPERFAEPRNEHRQTSAYRPFGLGTHTCLGARFVDFHLVACVMLIVHHLELKMVPLNYNLKISPLPKNSPNRGFKFRVERVRYPLD
ncbi:MAG: cytochrome P450 [Gammaproteobacteria bacterium]|nr:cytochrome P450 [Gammaproteobacteria bacterium]